MNAREEFIDEEPKTALMTVSDLEAQFHDPKRTALALPTQAHVIIVRDQDTLTFANDFLQGIKRLRRAIDDELDPGIEKAHALHKSLVAQKKKFTDPLTEAESAVKPKIANYLYEEDRKRFEAQRAAQLAEEKAARIAEETADKAHELIAQGKFKESQKVVEKAAAKIEEAKAAAPVVPEAVKAQGTSLIERWEFEVVDRSVVPEKYKVIDTALIGKIVRNLHDQHGIPGIRAYPVRSVASRIGE